MPPHYRDRLRFFAQWLRNPRQTAAIAPSGAGLTEAILAELPVGTRRVIELGGGTGAVTRALLAWGIADEDLLVLELNAALHAQLARDFPRACVLPGDAAELPRLAREANGRCGSGDAQPTWEACGTRDGCGRVLAMLGWCYRRQGAAAHQMIWHRCQANSIRMQ